MTHREVHICPGAPSKSGHPSFLPFEQGFDLRLVPEALELPLRWKAGRLVFVNSMSDLFHEDIPDGYVRRVFDVMRRATQHQFQVLTKRAERLAELAPSLAPPRNVWLGVSVENEDYVERVRILRRVKASVRFLSIEPLLGPIRRLPLSGIHWVIVGGESGGRARAMDPAWVRSVRDQCVAARVPFFFNQWGGVRKGKAGRVLDGRVWEEMPGVIAGRRALRVLAS